MKRSGRLVLVSNRGPYRLSLTRGGVKAERTVGGLVTSLLPLMEKTGGIWIAWGDPAGRYALPVRHPRFELRHLPLTSEEVRLFYLGFSNNALWPLCHYFLGRVRYDRAEWEMYEQVNQRFAQAVLEEAGDEDAIWVHDYHLARVPLFLRRQRPKARILFFWHIPFPAVDVFRTLPWRRPILEGLLACDLLGFHIPEYARNFIETVEELLGARADGETVHYAGRATRVLARPIGIDFAAVDRVARSRRTEQRVQKLRETLGPGALIVGVERLDYTKGIIERLRGVEHLLDHEPEWRGRFSLIQIVTPSRLDVEAYRQKKREIDEIVGRINGRFSDGLWIPIRYLHRAFPSSELVAYYRTADIALVTPLRDGLNLVAKEYVAARIHEDGVLILSEFAGVAYQLPEALITNPYSAEEMAAALKQALQMPKPEQRRRMKAMRDRLRAEDIWWWAAEFLEGFER
ncbi:trehalose-6-phosphate synthase [Thermoflexus sp.]|uniref:alpha,alpha-trehalose-phosphate synthase (UDP-forming) n=1 Tax=Thermoflexus sp. TaxID=1969742 RepID=UPI0035E42C09